MSRQTTKPQSENILKQAQVFEQAQVRRAFDRAAESYEQFAVLQKEVCNRLLQKLDIVKLQPQMILDAGAGTVWAADNREGFHGGAHLTRWAERNIRPPPGQTQTTVNEGLWPADDPWRTVSQENSSPLAVHRHP